MGPVAEPAYLTYVTGTVKHIAGEAGYGGSILDYGELDAQWEDGNGKPGGWAQDDVSEFRNVYLPDTYSTISAFNTANATSYTAFSQVPAATPGQALTQGQSLTSCNGDYALDLQGDGNLVLYQGGTAQWASNTSGSAADEAVMQGDGNVIVYSAAGAVLWATGTNGK